MSNFPIVTICGSMRYYQTMLVLAEHLTGQGNIVLMPYVTKYTGIAEPDEIKTMLDEMHLAKIDMAGTIYIVGTHIGESTKKEIDYAEVKGKLILYAANP